MNVYGASGNFAVTNGFPIAPEKPRPNQFQTRFSVISPSTQLATVTVIREDCRPVAMSVWTTGSKIQVRVNTNTIVFDQKTVTAF